MIPKLIHYCWFGCNSIPDDNASYIAGWKKQHPDYEFRFWNEANFDVNTAKFTAQVSETKKWGFIVDYMRAWCVFKFGGIFLDTDVEIIKPLDDLLENNICFAGFESNKFVNPGSIFAGEKGCHIAQELMDFYAEYSFIKADGELSLTASPVIFTEILQKYGLKQNNTYQKFGVFTAYPQDYFSPKDFITGKINITANTYSIHHYAMSWFSDLEIFLINRRRKITGSFGNNIITRTVLFILNFSTRCIRIGIKNTLSYYINRYIKGNP
ncbi:glycosyl transferase [Spirochaetia bacterium]|nr:glycosyl transferase [Spirochaetia bacterium]